MNFNSLDYLFFLPIVFLVYFILPAKVRYLWLLAASYYFYMNWNAKYALLLLLSTALTYISGIFIEKFKQKGKKKAAGWCVGICVCLNLAILFFFKYANFFIKNINRVLAAAGSLKSFELLDILLPVGISFYIFQALGYTFDVYRGNAAVEKNPFRYALFVSFFPQLVAGPIERSGNLLEQLRKPTYFEPERVREGLLTILWGLFIKIVIADTAAQIVNPVYENFAAHYGIEIAIATVLFAIQIYCDFSGYSYMAIGSARLLGFDLMDNFRSPYLAGNIREFWRRWHISLTTWFTDYIYIPLGGNRKGKIRKYINTMVVFLISGLWHGAGWTYVVWGGLNGIYLIVHDATAGFRARVNRLLKIDEGTLGHKFFSTVFTFFLVNIAWVLFRAPNIQTVLQIVRHFLRHPGLHMIFSSAIYGLMGLNVQTVVVMLGSLLLLLIVDWLRYRNIDVGGLVRKQGIAFRWLVYLGLLLMIFIFGIYGAGYEQTEFIYFQF